MACLNPYPNKANRTVYQNKNKDSAVSGNPTSTAPAHIPNWFFVKRLPNKAPFVQSRNAPMKKNIAARMTVTLRTLSPWNEMNIK